MGAGEHRGVACVQVLMCKSQYQTYGTSLLGNWVCPGGRVFSYIIVPSAQDLTCWKSSLQASQNGTFSVLSITMCFQNVEGRGQLSIFILFNYAQHRKNASKKRQLLDMKAFLNGRVMMQGQWSEIFFNLGDKLQSHQSQLLDPAVHVCVPKKGYVGKASSNPGRRRKYPEYKMVRILLLLRQYRPKLH